MRPPASEREFDLPFRAPYPLYAHLDLVAKTVRAATAPAHKARAERVHLEEVSRQAARGQVALEDLAEADEEAGLDDPDDLALEGRIPAALEKCRFEQPGKADSVRLVLDLRHLPLPGRDVLG